MEDGGVEDFDLIRRVETLGRPRVLVLGDLILDRYVWGDAERISQEAPVPLLRADRREHRLGGAASVATMLKALEAEVDLIAVVGADIEAEIARRILADMSIGDRYLIPIDGRPTTLKERYIGRAQDRHPQQMIRVDYEDRTPVASSVEMALAAHLTEAARSADIILVSDYDKGVCTPALLKFLIDLARSRRVPVIVDPIRGGNYAKYRGVSAITPNRLEAQLATGTTIRDPADAILAGNALVHRLNLDAAIVTLDRDGMAVCRRDGVAAIHPTRPRQVYDITGAGDMVLAVIGLCLADGASYDEAAALGNVAGGLEVEKIGVALLSRGELLDDLLAHRHAESPKRLDRQGFFAEIARRKSSGKKIVFTNGCFDLLHVGHVRLLREASRLGDVLVVGLNSDASVQALKGPSRPLQSQDDRAEVLAALEYVDLVVVFDEETPEELIRAIVPDVLVKGGDYRPDQVVGREIVEEAGGELVLIPLVAGRSTSHLVRRSAELGFVAHAPQLAPPAPKLASRAAPFREPVPE